MNSPHPFHSRLHRIKAGILCLLAVFVSLKSQAADPPSTTKAPASAPALDLRTLPIDARATLKSLKVGMTRKEIAQHFADDGGVVSPSSERYYLRDVSIPGAPGWVVMIEFTFQPKAMDDATFADAYRRGDWFRHHEWGPGTDNSQDIVRSVGKPYVSRIHLD